MNRLCLVALASLCFSACSTTGGGGGGGVATFNAGLACAATIVTDQCGVNTGHPAVLHCTGGVWLVVNDCSTGQSCSVKGGVAGCATISTNPGDTVSSSGDVSGDAVIAVDVIGIEDTFVTPDVPFTDDTGPKDTGPKDTGPADTGPKDTGVQFDSGPSGPTWGSCQINDQTCMQGCVQSNCAQAGSTCSNDPKCTALQTCFQNCNNSTDPNCQATCITAGGNAAIAEDEAYIDCVIGMCVDCNNTGDPTLAAADCKQLCGEQNNCLDSYNACLGDTDCLNTYGCLLSCAQGDTSCQQTCQTSATANTASLLNAFNTCDSANASVCSAP